MEPDPPHDQEGHVREAAAQVSPQLHPFPEEQIQLPDLLSSAATNNAEYHLQ